MKTVTPKQLAANRANAAHSTGPRTSEGKARSAQNARAHGLTAALYSPLRIEAHDAIEQMRDDTVAAYGPVNSEELLAVERIAIAKLALIRAARLEAGMFTLALNTSLSDDNYTPLLGPDPDPDRARDQQQNYTLADGFQRMAQSSNSWSLFLRYQAQAERQYRRAVEDFDRLKHIRNEIPNEPISDPPTRRNENSSPARPRTHPDPPGAAQRRSPNPARSASREAANPRFPTPGRTPAPAVLSGFTPDNLSGPPPAAPLSPCYFRPGTLESRLPLPRPWKCF